MPIPGIAAGAAAFHPAGAPAAHAPPANGRQFRKAYWNKELDLEVLKLDRNDVALNVLYIQVRCVHVP